MKRSIRKFLLLIATLLFPLLGFTQTIDIKGCIVEESDNTLYPVGYVYIALMKSDSTLIQGTTANEQGYFSFRGINEGDYLLMASLMSYEKTYVELKNLSKSIDLGNIRIISSLNDLSEVTLSASNYLNQIDRKIIFPDEKQIEKSTDGMDLLRNLQLSGIEVSRIDNSVKGARGGKVELRINGVLSNEKEVLAIKPGNIIRIEYHDEPSLRFGESEVVIDYILIRRETGGSFMLYGEKGMPGDKAFGYSVAKLNYRKSEFTLIGGVDHTNYDETYRTNREVLNFQDGQSTIRIEEGLPDKSKNDLMSVRLGYSLLEADKYHLYMNVGYNQHNPDNKSRSLLYSYGYKDNSILMTDYNRANNKHPYTNLYYQVNLKNEQTLIFDVVGTYYNSNIRRDYKEVRQENTLTDISTYIEGKRYSVIGEGFYEKMFKPGRLNIGFKQTQFYQKHKYSGNFTSETDMKQAITYFYAEWMGNISKFSYAAGIGGTRVYIQQDNTSSTEVRFTPTARLGYQFNNQFQIRYNIRSGVQAPSPGDMNFIEQAIDSLHIRRGNPSLKSVPYFHNLLTLSYNKREFTANLQILDNYSYHPIMESIFEENKKFIHKMENQKGLHQIMTTGYIKVSLLDGNLNMNIRGGLNRVKSWGDKYDHTMHNWFINGGIDYTLKRWNPFWNIATRRNNLTGETINYSSQSTYFGVRYKLKNITMSAYYNHNIGWNTGRKNLNQYTSAYIRNYSPDSQNLFLIDFVLNLQFGKKQENIQKKLNNSDNDSGIMNSGR